MQGAFQSPLIALEALWKHGKSVRAKGKSSQVTWKRLKQDDVRDLLAFLTDVGSQQGKAVTSHYLTPGDSQRGKRSFAKLNCTSCHEDDGTVKNKAGEGRAKRSNARLEIDNVVAAFWNHSPQVWRVLSESNRKSSFSAQTLADLTAYWYAERFGRSKGDAVLGESLFETKSCASCHEVGSDDFAIPEKKDELLAQMWSHVPDMVEACEDQDIQWLKVQPGELSAIAEYLIQSRAVGSQE